MKLAKGETLVVNHKLVQVIQTPTSVRVLISMEKGGQIETAPYPGNQQGLVAAMQIATEIMAGKIWLSHVASEAPGWTAPLTQQLTAPVDTTSRKI